MVEINISEDEKTILKEVAGMGLGHASSALEQLMNKKVELLLPEIDILAPTDIKRIFPDNAVLVGVHLHVLGDVKGNMLYLFKKQDACNMVKVLNNGVKAQVDCLNDFGISTIKEVSNILSGAYLSALSSFSGMNVLPSLPHMTVDNAESIFDFLSDGSQDSLQLIVIRSKLAIKDIELETEGMLVLVLGHEELNKLLTKIKEKYGANV